MFTWKRFILASGTVLLLALIFITLILPGMIVNHASHWIAQNTGRVLQVEEVRINPFSLSIEVHKLHLSDADRSKSFISWDFLNISLSVASLYHQAPVIDELRLDNPHIYLERLTNDLFNFSDLIPEKERMVDDEPAGDPFLFSMNNLSINGGQIDLIDSSLEQHRHHSIKDLQLALPTIGNLPYMVENPLKPLLKAVINDSPVNLEGRLKPFTDIQEMQFDLVLDNIDLPFYLDYIPTNLPVELRNGKLSLDLDILYRISPDKGGELELSGKLDLASLDIWDISHEKLFFLPLLQVDIAPSQPLKRQLHLSAVRAYNLEVQLNRDQEGGWNHARMATVEKEQSPSGEKVEQASSFRLMIDTIEIRDGVIFFADNLPTGGFSTVAREINIDVSNFSLDAMEGIPFKISLVTDHRESLKSNGHFLLTPFTLTLQTELENIYMGAYEPYYYDTYSGPLGGRLDLRAGLSINPEQPLLINDGAITWQNAYMAFNEQEGLGVALVDISGLSFDLNENKLEIDSAYYEDGDVNFSRDHEGHWSFLSRNFPILAKLTETPTEEQVPHVQTEGPEFSYKIGLLSIKNWQFAIQDDFPTTTVKMGASNFNLTFKNLAAPEKVESPFTFSTTFQSKGQIEINGMASLAKQSIQMHANLNRIPLSTFAPYLAEQANLILKEGDLNTRLKSTINAGGDLFELTYSGDLGISRLHLLDSLHNEDLLKWDGLQLAGIHGQSEPLSLGIESITLSDYFAKVLIDEDARLNLAEAFRKGDASDTAEPESDTTATEKKGIDIEESREETSQTPDISIGAVTLQGGQVDFTDRSLSRPFHADMRELGGRIQGLSTDPATYADVDLRGRLRNQSPLVINGTVNPLAKPMSMDLKLSFNDIELSPLSPYSGTYAGYIIEKGKLNLAMEYHLEDEKLKASNNVFLDQFSLGESVESDQATSLPVKLAVALLKDKDGEIHLDIPVSGSLDDPQFSVSGVIWTVIKNLLVKAATSPLALLGTLVGGADEDFSSVNFTYGSARLDDAEKDKLERMSQALKDRPSLEVEVSGFVDPDKDPDGFRREKLIMMIKRLKYLDLIREKELPKGASEYDVIVPAEQYAEYLWQVYQEADFPKPRSFIGMIKKLPAAEMEKLIYTNTAVTQDDLAGLAQARALAVQKYLVEEGHLTPSRIFLIEADITSEPDQGAALRARVELDATVR